MAATGVQATWGLAHFFTSEDIFFRTSLVRPLVLSTVTHLNMLVFQSKCTTALILSQTFLSGGTHFFFPCLGLILFNCFLVNTVLNTFCTVCSICFCTLLSFPFPLLLGGLFSLCQTVAVYYTCLCCPVYRACPLLWYLFSVYTGKLLSFITNVFLFFVRLSALLSAFSQL